MDIIISIAIFFVGMLLGVFLFKTFATSSIEQKALTEKVNQSETALAKYKLDVAEHLDSSAQLLSQMNETCQAAMTQMEKSTQLLKQATPTKVDNMPFFSKETQDHLTQTVALRNDKPQASLDTPITEAPLDYSEQASGLFSDKKQAVTNANS